MEHIHKTHLRSDGVPRYKCHDSSVMSRYLVNHTIASSLTRPLSVSRVLNACFVITQNKPRWFLIEILPLLLPHQ